MLQTLLNFFPKLQYKFIHFQDKMSLDVLDIGILLDTILETIFTTPVFPIVYQNFILSLDVSIV